MLKKITFLVHFFILNVAFLSAQTSFQVVGEATLCQGARAFYHIDIDSVQVEWQVFGSNYFTEVNNGIEVFWRNDGTGKVVASVIYNDGSRANASLNIQVNEKPRANIVDDAGAIFFSQDRLDFDSIPNDSAVDFSCSPACELFPAIYQSQFPNGNTHLWTANGGTIINGGNDELSEVKWNANANTYLQLLVSNEFGCTDSVQICVSVFEKPTASFTANNSCVGGDIFFKNTSVQGKKFLWDFGDGTSSKERHPTHAYATGGEFEVKLYTYNSYNCIDSTSQTVLINEKVAPVINCIGPACLGSTVLYNTSDQCSSYNWAIIGGTLKAGQGTKTIEVEWNENVPNGTIELQANGCEGNLCPEKAVVNVALIQPNLPILGETSPCAYSETTYALDPIPGAIYSWSIEGSGNIQSTTSSSSVVVYWYGTGQGKVVVNYNNPTLGCAGTSELIVATKEKSYLYTPWVICAGMIELATTNSANVEWSVVGGEIVNAEIDKLTFKPGINETMIVSFENKDINFCSSTESRIITVTPPVPPIDFVNGDTLICIGETYRYETNFFDLDKYRVNWILDAGTKQTASGNYSDLTWSANNGKVSANLISRSNSTCKGDTAMIEVAEYGEYNYDFNIDGTYCTNLPLSLNATINNGLAKDIDGTYNWSIIPSQAGVFVSGQYTKNAQLQLNDYAGAATLKLEVKACDKSIAVLGKQIEIKSPVPAEIIVSSPFCEGGTATITTNASEVLSWEFNGNVQSTGQDDLNVTTEGLVVLNYIDLNGCTSSVYDYIEPDPLPLLCQSSRNPEICEGTAINETLFTLDADGYSFAWEKDGNILSGENQAKIQTTETGGYKVTVTNSYNCSNTREFLVSRRNCSLVGDYCTPSQSVLFSMQQTCNEITFTNNSPANATDLVLQFGDGSSYTFTSPGETIKHVYNVSADRYSAILTGTVPGNDQNGNPTQCTSRMSEDFDITLNAAFIKGTFCSGLTYGCEETATWLPGNEVTNWQWDFGDPASGSANTSVLRKPNHTYPSSGIYKVTLTVSNAECSRTYSDDVVIKIPDVDFDIENPLCLNTPIEVNVPQATLNSSDVHEYFFNGNPRTNFDKFTHTFPTAGAHTVKLKAIKGKCSNEKTISVNVNSPLSLASINSSDPFAFCSGDSALLTASNGLSYQWSNLSTTQSIYAKTEGFYAVTLYDQLGCLQTTDPVDIDINLRPKPFVFSTDAPGFCKEYNRVEVDYIRDHSYKWFLNDQPEPSNSYRLYTNKEGDFVSQITNDLNNCTGTSDPYTLEKHQISSLNISSNKGNKVCSGVAVELTASSADENLIYTWQHNNSHNNKITAGQEGYYYVTAKNEFGCSQSASFFLSVDAMPNANQVMSGCFEACDEASIPLVGISGFANVWYKEDVNNWNYYDQRHKTTVTETGSYRAIVSNYYNNNCRDTSNVSYIKFEECAKLELPPILISDKTEICLGDSILFEVETEISSLFLEFKAQGAPDFIELYELESTSFYELASVSGIYRVRAYAESELISNEIFIEVNTYPNPGNIIADKEQYCEDEMVLLELKDFEGVLVSWEKWSQIDQDYISLTNNDNPFSILIEEEGLLIRAAVANKTCIAYSEINILKPHKKPIISDLSISLEALCSTDTVVLSSTYTGEFVSWQVAVESGPFQTIGEISTSWIDVPTDSTTYVLSVKNGVCPILTDTVAVNVFDSFDYSLDPLVCANGDLIQFGFDNDDFEFEVTMTDENGTQSIVDLNKSNDFSINIGNLPGTYYFSLFEGTCYQELNDSSIVVSLPEINVNRIDSTSCFGFSNGAIEVQTSLDIDLNSILNWTLKDSLEFTASTEIIENLKAGEYEITLAYEDLPLCSTTQIINVGEPLKLNAIIKKVVGETCEDLDNGLLEVTVEGGTSAFQATVYADGVLIPESQVDISGRNISITSIWPGLGQIEVVDGKGCISTVDFEIETAPLFDILLDFQINPLCANENSGQVKITTSGTVGDARFEWSDGNTTTDSSRTDLLPGGGQVKIITGLGCVDSIAFNLVAPPIIEVLIDSILNTCIGELGGYLSATAIGGTGKLTYGWSNGTSGQVNANLGSGIYTITVTDENGCESMLQEQVKGNQKPIVDINYAGPFCGDKNLSLTVTPGSNEIEVSNGTSANLFVEQTSNSQFEVSTTVFGNFNFEIQLNNDGCLGVFQDSILFKVQPTSLFDYNATKVDLGYNFAFNNQSLNGETYVWRFGAGAAPYFGLNPDTISLSLDQSLDAEVCLEVTSALGCVDEFCLDLELSGVLSDVMIPNSFTPNGDAINDKFMPVFSGIVPTFYSFNIWSKWGDLVFTTENPEEGWDGNLNGLPISSGIYIYTIQFKNGTSDDWFYKKGSISIYR